MAKIIDKLAWLYLKDGKLLSARSKNKQLFYVPGGKRETGESDHQALVREIKEEISVDLVPESIQYADKFIAQADSKTDGTQVQLSCYFADYKGELSPAAEIEEIDFLAYEDIPLCSAASVKVMEWLKQQNLLN